MSLTKEQKNRRVIGSSDAPIIMGTSPYATPYQLWEEMLGFRERKVTKAMQRGSDLEDSAKRWFESKMNTILFPTPVKHKEHSFMTATLDGIDDECTHMVEIKWPNKEFHEMAKKGKVPDAYYPQVQHQLEAASSHFGVKIEGMYYLSCYESEKVLVEVAKDTSYISKMIDQESVFYYENILNETPPELCDRDYIRREDSEWASIASQWLEITEKLKPLELAEKTIREKLITLSDKKNIMGSGVRLTSFARRGNVDYSKIPEIANVDLDKYRKRSTIQVRISSLI